MLEYDLELLELLDLLQCIEAHLCSVRCWVSGMTSYHIENFVCTVTAGTKAALAILHVRFKCLFVNQYHKHFYCIFC